MFRKVAFINLLLPSGSRQRGQAFEVPLTMAFFNDGPDILISVFEPTKNLGVHTDNASSPRDAAHKAWWTKLQGKALLQGSVRGV